MLNFLTYYKAFRYLSQLVNSLKDISLSLQKGGFHPPAENIVISTLNNLGCIGWICSMGDLLLLFRKYKWPDYFIFCFIYLMLFYIFFHWGPMVHVSVIYFWKVDKLHFCLCNEQTLKYVKQKPCWFFRTLI